MKKNHLFIASFLPMIIASCNFSGKVVIVNTGRVYWGINTTDCLDWKDKQIGGKAGSNYWQLKGFPLKNGLKGRIMEEYYHCDLPDTKVYLIKIDNFEDYYMVVNSDGFRKE